MWTHHGWFKLVSWDEESRDIELDCNGLEDPGVEIAFCEWNQGTPNWNGLLSFRDETYKIHNLGLLIVRSHGNVQKHIPARMAINFSFVDASLVEKDVEFLAEQFKKI